MDEHMALKLYTGIWVLLVGLTLMEILMVMFNLSPLIILLGVLGIAAIKALFVALYYQHLKYDDIAISWFYLMALFFALFIVMVFTGGSAVCQV